MPCLCSVVYVQLIFTARATLPLGQGGKESLSYVWECRDTACRVRFIPVSDKACVSFAFFRTRHAVSLQVIGYSCRDAACSVRIVVRVGVFVFFVFGRCTLRPYCPDGLGGVFPFIRLVFSFHLSVFRLFNPPPPLRSSPCLRGTVYWRGEGVGKTLACLKGTPMI